MIQAKNLTKKYGSLVAVDNINFHVTEGEVVGFLGPNGAGKTTTLRILTCYQPATSGSASVAGFDVFTRSMEVRKCIGYLPESAPMYGDMRVREYLHFRGKLHGLDRSRRLNAIERVTKQCWLEEFVNRPIGQLSKGMRQRVGLADALLHEPKVLILDEPTIGLDPNQIRETRNLIRELGRRHTIIFSSHILPEVEAVCTRTIIIANGRIVASGSPDELRERVSASSRLMAEIRGPENEVKGQIQSLDGVRKIECHLDGGWNHLAIDTENRRDLREDIFSLVTKKGWQMREIRREVASLEDFFVKITAEQRSQAR